MLDHDLSGITLEQISLFLRAVEAGSFTEAGRGYYLTQSTVSRKISALESTIQLQLFLREHGKIRPTPAGERMYQELDGMIARFEAAVAIASKEEENLLNTIVVGVLDPLLLDKLMDIIASFRRFYPMTIVRLETYEFAELRSRLKEGSLDIVLTLAYESPSFPSLYERYALDEDIMYVYLSKSHPLATRTQITMEDLREERFVIHNPALVPSYYGLLEELCARYGFRPEIGRVVDNHNALYPALLQNEGVLIAGASFGTAGYHNIIRFPLSDTTSGQMIVWRRDNRQKNLKQFLELCIRELQRDSRQIRVE